MTELIPRQLGDPIFDEYPVSHEKLVRKMDRIVEFTAHYEDTSGKQTISTAFVPGDGVSKETIIINVPWSDSAHRDFNKLRHAALAEHTGADVILIGFPGYDEGVENGLTSLQIEDLQRKDGHSFSEVGKALASAGKQISDIKEIGGINYWNDRQVTVAGCSQGASSQMGMLKHLDKIIAERVSDLYIWESADALKKQAKPILVGKFIIDSLSAGSYFKENELVFGQENARKLGIHDKGFEGVKELKDMLAAKKEYLLHGAADAIAGSTIVRDIKDVYDEGRLHDVRIHVIQGEKGVVSPTRQNQKLLKILMSQAKETGEKIHVIRKGDKHPHQESFPRYTSTVEELKK